MDASCWDDPSSENNLGLCCLYPPRGPKIPEIQVGLIVRFKGSLKVGQRYRVAQEPNRNRKPEPSKPFSRKAEPEPPEPFSRNRNRNRNRPFLLNCTETQKNLFAEEPSELKTGTAGTVPSPNRNRTEPNRGLPEGIGICVLLTCFWPTFRDPPKFFGPTFDLLEISGISGASRRTKAT